MNHDEFMRRVLALASVPEAERHRFEARGDHYLRMVQQMDITSRALSIASYEDGGLETVFRAILAARDWDSPALGAFHHFLVEHIRLDSGEHGGLCRHLVADDRIAPLWSAFRNLLVGAVPRLAA